MNESYDISDTKSNPYVERHEGQNEGQSVNPKSIYKSTFRFVLLKLLLQLGGLFLSAALLCIITVVGTAISSNIVKYLLFLLWGIFLMRSGTIVNRFGGYLIRAGHIATVSHIAQTGKVPRDVIGYGVDKVKERFAVASAYYLASGLIKKIIKQLQGNTKVSLLSFGPLGGFGEVFVNRYIGVIVNSVPDCCLSYTYMRPKHRPFQAACEGVTLYVKNWATVMKTAAVTVGWSFLFLLCFYVVGGVLVVLPIIAAPGSISLIIPCVLIAMYLVTGIKEAVVDSYTMVKMVSSFNATILENGKLPKVDKEDFRMMRNSAPGFKQLSKAAAKEKREYEATVTSY